MIEKIKPGLIVSAQPTMDRTVFVDNFLTGQTFRISSVIKLASGKAINVARSLHSLGFPINVISLLGGFTGQWIFQELNKINITVFPVWVEGENRIAYSIYDPLKNTLTQLIENNDGPISFEKWTELKKEVKKYLLDSSSLILTGRGSAGFPDTGYQELIDIAHEYSLPIYVDCYGSLLKNALKSKPTVLKINVHEAEIILDCRITSIEECIRVLSEFLNFGVKIVIITIGENGAVAADSHESWFAVPPKLKGIDVGSGDAFLAGIIYGMAQNWPIDASLKYGVAAGSANVLMPGAGLFNISDLNTIYKQIGLHRVG